MSTPNYDVYYFIRKFAALPDELWGCVAHYTDEGERCSAHYTYTSGSERRALRNLLDHKPECINDGFDPRYQQSTPKKRILAALRDVACSQLPDDNSDGDFILNTAFGPVTIVEDPLVDPNSYGFVLPNKTWSTI